MQGPPGCSAGPGAVRQRLPMKPGEKRPQQGAEETSKHPWGKPGWPLGATGARGARRKAGQRGPRGRGTPWGVRKAHRERARACKTPGAGGPGGEGQGPPAEEPGPRPALTRKGAEGPSLSARRGGSTPPPPLSTTPGVTRQYGRFTSGL